MHLFIYQWDFQRMIYLFIHNPETTYELFIGIFWRLSDRSTSLTVCAMLGKLLMAAGLASVYVYTGKSFKKMIEWRKNKNQF